MRVRTHPGEVLRQEFMEPHGLSARALAAEIGVPANRISDLVRGVRSLTAETAILLGERFGTDPRFWLNLQTNYDLSVAMQSRQKSKSSIV